MSDDQVGPRFEPEGQERQYELRDPGTPTHYANFFTVTGGRDAALLAFGNMFGPGQVIQLESKVVLSPRNAKRLALSLGQLIRRYEQEHGEIDISTGQQQPPAGPE